MLKDGSGSLLRIIPQSEVRHSSFMEPRSQDWSTGRVASVGMYMLSRLHKDMEKATTYCTGVDR